MSVLLLIQHANSLRRIIPPSVARPAVSRVSSLSQVRHNFREKKVLLASYIAAPHNRYQPHPAEPEQYTTCSNTVFVLLKMGIMMPETC